MKVKLSTILSFGLCRQRRKHEVYTKDDQNKKQHEKDADEGYASIMNGVDEYGEQTEKCLIVECISEDTNKSIREEKPQNLDEKLICEDGTRMWNVISEHQKRADAAAVVDEGTNPTLFKKTVFGAKSVGETDSLTPDVTSDEESGTWGVVNSTEAFRSFPLPNDWDSTTQESSYSISSFEGKSNVEIVRKESSNASVWTDVSFEEVPFSASDRDVYVAGGGPSEDPMKVTQPAEPQNMLEMYKSLTHNMGEPSAEKAIGSKLSACTSDGTRAQ